MGWGGAWVGRCGGGCTEMGGVSGWRVGGGEGKGEGGDVRGLLARRFWGRRHGRLGV